MLVGSRKAAAMATFCLVVAACEQGGPPPPAVSPPDLQIVTAGSEPRQVLRYHAPAGTEQPLEMSIAVELTAGELGGAMPTVVLAMTYAVDAVMPSGQRAVRATIDRVTAVDAANSTVLAASMQGPLATLEGLTIYSVLGANGRITASNLAPTARPIAPELAQQLQSLVRSFESTMMVLPDEPVGVGAVWRNSRPVEQNGLRLKAVNTVTLSAIDGDTIAYQLETDIHGDDQSLPQGEVTIDVKDVIGSGAGTGTIDLGTLAVTSELAAQLRAQMSASGDTEPTPMQMGSVLKVRPL